MALSRRREHSSPTPAPPASQSLSAAKCTASQCFLSDPGSGVTWGVSGTNAGDVCPETGALFGGPQAETTTTAHSGLGTEEHLGTRLARPIDGLLLPPGVHCGKDNRSHSPQKATWKPGMRTAAPGTTRGSWAMRIWRVSDRAGERPTAQPRVVRWNGKGLDAWLRHLPPSCQTPLIWADAVLGAWWALGT